MRLLAGLLAGTVSSKHRWFSLALFAAVSVAAQQPAKVAPASQPEITIARKPGQQDGQAQMIVKGKVRKIAPHAVAAWTVKGGEGALLIVLQSAKGIVAKQYQLRYYDLDSGRRRFLGTVPIDAATLTETQDRSERWAFALAGTDLKTSEHVIVVGDEEAIPGLLPGASSPVFHGDTLTYASNGESKNIQLGLLLGTSLGKIYTPPQGPQTAPKFLQVFPNGTAMIETADGTIHDGEWQTDGQVLRLHSETGTAIYSVPRAELQPIAGIPAGKRYSVRLTQELSSRTTHEGAIVKAISIEPVVVDGEILIPAGSTFEGKVIEADSVGWGFKHETASLTIDWTQATLPEGRILPIAARVFQVENAQESVNDKGKIQGIRSTGTPGHSAENGVLTFAGIDPIAYIFASASGSAVLGFAEPEILYHAGTELVLENVKPTITSQVYPPSVLPAATTPEQQQQLQAFIKKLPYRTRTKGSNKVSDITSIVFIGPAAGLKRAFLAAGWLPTDELTATSTFRTLKTLSGNQTYTQAPMSVLLLDERAPLFTLSKTTNTFSSRHHVRIFPTAETLNGSTVLTTSATQDIGIAFSKKQKTFIHVIDQHIDNERSKVINDLQMTGCVESLDMVERPWVPTDAYNSTGDRLLTDGEAAVIHISACENPQTTPNTSAPAPDRFERITRDTSLTIRNDVYRGNLIYQGIAGGFAVRKYLRSSSELPENYGAWRKTDASGAEYKGLGRRPELLHRAPEEFSEPPSAEDRAAIAKAREDHKWDPPRYELAIQGGYLHLGANYLTSTSVIFVSTDLTKPYYEIDLDDVVDDGWAGGGSVTVNSWKHFSNEFSYFRQQIKYQFDTTNYKATLQSNGIDYDEDTQVEADKIGLVTRQFEYNLLAQARPPTSRWRPYIAAGPVVQLIALNGAPLKKPAGVFQLGLKNIGLIKAAFDFGNTPALDGGGIFQFGLQYGAGFKYRVSPRVMLRVDWRETWSKNPNIVGSSYQDYDPDGVLEDPTYDTDVITIKPASKFIQDRYTVGVAFTF